MDPRFVTKKMHAYLDYPVALTLMGAPLLLGLGHSHPLALYLSMGAGAAAFVLTLLTDHHLGVLRVLPYWFHRLADFSVAVVFLVASFVFGFKGIDAWYYWANAAAVMVVVGLHTPEQVVEQASIREVTTENA